MTKDQLDKAKVIERKHVSLIRNLEHAKGKAGTLMREALNFNDGAYKYIYDVLFNMLDSAIKNAEDAMIEELKNI